MKVYGPYVGKDNRSRVVLVHNDDTKQTMSYPRYIIQEYLGATLEDYEDVHHIDGNVKNNDITNLEVVLKSNHVREHSLKYRDDVYVNCFYCNVEFILTPKQQSERFRSANKGKAGPFCSKSCSGKYGTEIQRALK